MLMRFLDRNAGTHLAVNTLQFYPFVQFGLQCQSLAMWIQTPICGGDLKLPSFGVDSVWKNGRRARVATRGSKLVINNQKLYREPSALFPGILDRSTNGIYLSNERADVDKALENRKRKVGQ